MALNKKKYYEGALFSKDFQDFENGRSSTVGIYTIVEMDDSRDWVKFKSVTSNEVIEGEIGTYEMTIQRLVYLDKKKKENFIATYEDYVNKAKEMEKLADFLSSEMI